MSSRPVSSRFGPYRPPGYFDVKRLPRGAARNIDVSRLYAEIEQLATSGEVIKAKELLESAKKKRKFTADPCLPQQIQNEQNRINEIYKSWAQEIVDREFKFDIRQ